MDDLARARALTTTRLAFELLRSVYLDLANAVAAAKEGPGALLLSDTEKRAALIFAVIEAEAPKATARAEVVDTAIRQVCAVMDEARTAAGLLTDEAQSA